MSAGTSAARPPSLQLAPATAATMEFADEVGSEGDVFCAGGGTHMNGRVFPDAARVVRAPVGIVAHHPDEMIIRVHAGTTVREVAGVLAESGQHCPLDPLHPEATTVGGALAVGLSGIRRLRYGHIRDLLLEARYVASDASVIKAGAPVVKNVTGYDLCRLLVGSWGTLGFLSEVVLRCTPRPMMGQWYWSEADPWTIRAHMFRPSAVLWDGNRTYVLLEGRHEEIEAERALLSSYSRPTRCDPPPIPEGGRIGVPPAELRHLSFEPGQFLAEIGVGVVHLQHRPTSAPLTTSVQNLNETLKRAYDPTGRLNRGFEPW